MYSERPVARRQSQQEHRPDAEVQIGGHTVAIEVELTAKTPKQLPAILYGLQMLLSQGSIQRVEREAEQICQSCRRCPFPIKPVPLAESAAR